VQILQKLVPHIFRWIANIALLATASAHDRILPELPQTNTPVMLVAASDPATGKSEFRYQGNNTPPVIRVQPGSTLNVEYKNELAAQSREDCVGHPCMQMTNLHFHGLHVSPNAPQDDVLDMMASHGET
jgi:suppressor of ftsI